MNIKPVEPGRGKLCGTTTTAVLPGLDGTARIYFIKAVLSLALTSINELVRIGAAW